ncbi:hypothetical protein FQA39_LY07630 [Lamprigera yunnana]|nr:hypothetical protein FQA39_LY07630 [Lamprigera yunnana]
MKESDPNDIDYQHQLIYVRQKYTKGIQDLLKQQALYKIKKIEKHNDVKVPLDENIAVPSLNDPVNTSSIPDKNWVSNLTTKLKQQARAINIINKNANCPTAQVMDKL